MNRPEAMKTLLTSGLTAALVDVVNGGKPTLRERRRTVR